MAVHINPRIATDDLIQCIDFSSPRCLPLGFAGTLSGSQTSASTAQTFYDLSPRKNHLIAQNGVSWNGTTATITDTAGYFRGSSGGSNFGWATDPGNGIDQSESTICFELAYNSTDDGYLLSRAWNGSGQYNYGIYPGGFFFFAGATSSSMSVSGFVNNGINTHIVVWANHSQIGYYVNGGTAANAFGVATGAQGAQNHGITNGGTPSSGYSVGGLQWGTLYPYGHGWGGTEGFTNKATYHFVRVYRRKLTDNEVLQNFLATRNRLGI